MEDTVKYLVELASTTTDRNWGVLSTSQQLVTAMMLGRMDWLESLGYSIPKAITRIGPKWCNAIGEAEYEYNKIIWQREAESSRSSNLSVDK